MFCPFILASIEYIRLLCIKSVIIPQYFLCRFKKCAYFCFVFVIIGNYDDEIKRPMKMNVKILIIYLNPNILIT